jgi:pilus assembly protein CpaB
MDAKKIALLVAALLIAGVTAFMANSLFSGASAPTVKAAIMPEKKGPEILVATRALPIGTIIEPDSFRYQPWPAELVQNAYYLKGEADPASLAGTVVRDAVSAGQPLTKGQLVKPGERGFLAAALSPGMRAITVQTNTKGGVAGFVFPGDRVDLVLTQEVDGDDGPPLRSSETIIRNLRVLATDQRTVPETAEGKRDVKIFELVTVEVTPRIAEKIAVAADIGKLSFSLRSLADNTAELERAIASGEIKVPEGTDPKAENQFLLSVATRPIDSDPTFVTGADVSRFQRRSLPKTKSASGSNGGNTSSFASQPSFSQPRAEPTPPPPPPVPTIRIARGNNVTEVPVGGK